MTHLAQEKTGVGNTVLPPKKARNWCFTLNNYTKSDIAQLHKEKWNINTKQFCFQEEMGTEKVPHLQGVIAYKNARSLLTMKKVNSRAHWEVCRSLKASLAYCSKADTRNGDTFTYNYKIIKILTDEEFEQWEQDELERDVEKTLKKMKGWSLSI